MGRDPAWWGLRSHYQRLGCLGLPVGGQSTLVQGLEQGFLQSAPPQRLLTVSPDGPRLENTDTPGWNLYTVADGTTSQTFIFEVQVSGESLTFFPRASGADSSVEVAALKGGDKGKAIPLARLAGKAGEWSPHQCPLVRAAHLPGPRQTHHATRDAHRSVGAALGQGGSCVLLEWRSQNKFIQLNNLNQ